jgi:hypothetical protein
LGGYGGFYRFYGRGYRIFIKINYFIKIFYNNTYAEVHCKEKRKRGYTLNGGYGVMDLLFILFFSFGRYSGVRGGGKCPEEEHTTCSGGPTINCHKRGLRGERKIFSKKENIL